MIVVKKTVSRWFVNGKGYSNKTNAYKSIATKELKAMVYSKAVMIRNHETGSRSAYIDSEDSGKWVHRAYMELFPKTMLDGTMCPFDESPAINFKARKAWIDDRTQELMGQYK